MASDMVKTSTRGIFKRGSRYVFSYRVDGKQHWRSCRTLAEARQAKAAVSADIGRGEFEPRSTVTLHEYVKGVDRALSGHVPRVPRGNPARVPMPDREAHPAVLLAQGEADGRDAVDGREVHLLAG
jgi:hypothetical protein